MFDSARPRVLRAPHHHSDTPHTPVSHRRIKQALTALILIVAGVTALPAASVEHTVSSGEALSGIADQYDVSVAALAEANDLADPNLIFAGQTLRVPVDTASPAPAAGYTVVAGDSLWNIALSLNVSLAELMAVNDLAGTSIIVPGQVLVVPGSDVAASGTDQTTQVHIVEAGDSLWRIAVDHGVTLSALLDANALGSSAVIVPGQEIVLPDRTTAEVPLVIPADIPAELAADPQRLALMPIFDRWANAYDVPADLVKAVAWFESGWNNEVVSSAGARGIGQVLPITGDWVAAEMIGLPLDLGVPDDNIRISARYLRYLLDRTGDVRLAVASYYQGLTATRQHGIYTSSQFYVDGIIALRERFD